MYDDRRHSVLLLFPIFFWAALKCLSASADVLSFALSDHRKDPVNFASFVSDIDCRADCLFVALRHRFSKERYNFPLNDFIVAEPANTFAEAVSHDSVSEQVEGSRNEVGINLIVSLFGVRPILQAIHRVGELTDFGVSDCEFDFI
jgi:hypothetical protein